MPTYEYVNSDGEEREVVASIRNVPPEHIRFKKDGGFVACNADHPDVFSRRYRIGNAHVRKFTTWRSPLTGGKVMDF